MGWWERTEVPCLLCDEGPLLDEILLINSVKTPIRKFSTWLPCKGVVGEAWLGHNTGVDLFNNRLGTYTSDGKTFLVKSSH